MEYHIDDDGGDECWVEADDMTAFIIVVKQKSHHDFDDSFQAILLDHEDVKVPTVLPATISMSLVVSLVISMSLVVSLVLVFGCLCRFVASVQQLC